MNKHISPRYKMIKKGLCGLLIAGAMLGLTGCGSTVDQKDDPLAGYSADSLLPFSTRDPALTTAVPEAAGADVAAGGTVRPTGTPIPTRAVPTATAATYTRIEPGDSGENVRALQARLIQLGYLTGTPDGNYGTQTQNAVRLFQKALGISQTGIANQSLQERLFSATAPTYAAANATAAPSTVNNPTGGTVNVNTGGTVTTTGSYTTLVRGDSGDRVSALQRRLQELGYLSGRADGQFGAMTETAVKQFQAQLGLTQSGVASASLQERLFSASAPYAPVTQAPRVTVAPTARPTAVPTAAPTYNPYGGYTELVYGTKNSLAVQQMQNRLKTLGYFSATATGNYYSETAAAVSAFQRAMGLAETGTATPETLYWLYSQSAVPYSATARPSVTATPMPTVSGYTTLYSGSRGAEVVSLQRRLIALGWATGSADGIYGAQTVTAVKRFQEAVGYEPTGIATEQLQTILFSSVAPVNSATAAPTAVVTATPMPTNTPQPVVTAEPAYITLQYNSTGTRVEALQQRLKDLGYFSGNVAGNYLAKTQSAVILFQRALGWPQDGVATVALQEALFAPNAPAYGGVSSGYAQLERGDSGVQVSNMQRRLIELGYLAGTADGTYGGNTQNAVAAFQLQAGLTADGVASIVTLDRLYAYNAPTAPTPVPTQAPIEVTATPEPIVTQAPAQPQAQTGLQPGDTGEAVMAMQQRLQELGYFTGEIGGNYLAKTTAAVQAFQTAIGWQPDGIASDALLERLYSADAPAYNAAAYGYISLSKGSHGPSVRALQQRLIDLGWLSGSADGDFGGNTENAVIAFQTAVGLSATGVADDMTQTSLFAENAPTYVAPVIDETPYGGVTDYEPVIDEPIYDEPIYDEPTYDDPTYDQPTDDQPTGGQQQAQGGLQPGDTGEAVMAMQRRLQELGYFTGDIGGNYLAKTTAAVQAFQEAIGWQPDGIATAELLERLYSADAPANAEFITLREGDKGPRVMNLQRRLIELGYLEENKDTTDGDFGPMLTGAIQAVQAAMGLAPDLCTGIADAELQQFLFSDAAESIRVIG